MYIIVTYYKLLYYFYIYMYIFFYKINFTYLLVLCKLNVYELLLLVQQLTGSGM